MCDVKYQVRLLPLVKDDLNQIKNYLSHACTNTTMQVLGELKAKIIKLPEHPYVCEEFSDDSFYKITEVSNYNIYYHINIKKKMIEIHRILRCSWDVRKYLNERP